MRRNSYWLLLTLASLVFAGGCDLLGGEKEEPAKTATKRDKPPQRRDDTAKKRVEPDEAPVATEEAWSFDFDPAAKARHCFARIIVIPPNGPAVLKITSYQSPEQESFPSFLLSAQVADGKPESLVGQSVPAVMFVRLTADGPIYENDGAEAVQLEITEQQPGKLLGNVQGRLRMTGSQEQFEIKGNFEAELPGGTP